MQLDAPNRRSIWTAYVDAVMARPALTLGLAAVLFCALGWWQAGINIDSTTYSVIARNIAEHGGWFHPTYTPYYHTHFAEHPPLVMWLQALVFMLFGANDSTARIIGQLCTIGSVLAVYGLAKEAGDRRLGILTGIVLLLTYNFMQIGNSTLLDVPMTFFILLALWGTARLQKTPVGEAVPPGVAVAVGLALGAAFLAKGVVAGPAFLAAAVAALVLRRDWLRQTRFWLMPAAAVAVIGIYLLGDIAYAGGHFTRYYFAKQIWQRFLGGGPEMHTDWYEFVWRGIKLYLPFVVVLPAGIYLVIKRRMSLLYPTLITLAAYALFYSTAAKIYLHYYSPVYALAAPLAAVAIGALLSERATRQVLAVFIGLWVLTAVAVTAAGVRIHEIRLASIYNLTSDMDRLLAGRPTRDGLMIRVGYPHWDVVAKSSWYWRSDILTVPNLGTADDSLYADSRYHYILVERSDVLGQSRLDDLGLSIYARSGEFVVLTRDRKQARP